jgi:hypothetical protein
MFPIGPCFLRAKTRPNIPYAELGIVAIPLGFILVPWW